jgi:hypothetical protein
VCRADGRSAVGAHGDVEGSDRNVVYEDLGFGDGQVEIEHVQEFSFDSPDVPAAKDSCA